VINQSVSADKTWKWSPHDDGIEQTSYEQFYRLHQHRERGFGHAADFPKSIFYVPGRSEPLQGPSGYLTIIGMMRAGFPDIQWTLKGLIAEDDNVAARFTMRGTHKGALFGVPPSGKKIEVKAMNFYRITDGRIVEEHGQPDLLGLLQQIGAAPI
jgi:steroid delta-isomerase-like uncharacterized protein